MSHGSPLSITYRPIGELRADPGNARTHPAKQIDQIAASLQTFGFANPILIDQRSVVIAGHGRLRAAKKLGLKAVPTIMLDHLSEAEAKALRLADNRIAQNSGWDRDLLKVTLDQLAAPEVSFDLEVIGFSPGEIDVILSPARTAADDEALPALPSEPLTRPGDIWALGDHRIGCGDCRDAAFVGKVMGPGVVADAAFLDPPYNVGIASHANVRPRHREFAMASGEMSPEEYIAFLRAGLTVAAGVSRDGAVHFVMTDWRHIDALKALADQVYGAVLNLCVWVKANAGMGSLYRSQHELVVVCRVGTASHFNAIELGRHGRHRTNVWDYPASTSPRGNGRQDLELHPTVKPVAMVADAIKDVTRRGDVVLDLHLGSGTTLIAAERAGRRCRGVEIDAAYVDAIVERWTNLTGLEARRLASGTEDM